MNIPSREALQQIVDSGVADVAELLIKEHKLKYKIQDGKVISYTQETEAWLSRFITVNKEMITLKENVRKLSSVDDPVLIVGPTGTGKELLAHALHGDKTGKFVAINCAGLPDTLIESELFGYMAGAFTGATNSRKGLMAEAEDGTLFLDEIGDFPLGVQAKLLRSIQEKIVRRVGGVKEEAINCRIVCATHRDLTQMVKHDKFRIDLYARISMFELKTTSLQERPEDIVPIIKSLPGGDKFAEAHKEFLNSNIDISLNVRDLIKLVRRYQVLGTI